MPWQLSFNIAGINLASSEQMAIRVYWLIQHLGLDLNLLFGWMKLVLRDLLSYAYLTQSSLKVEATTPKVATMSLVAREFRSSNTAEGLQQLSFLLELQWGYGVCLKEESVFSRVLNPRTQLLLWRRTPLWLTYHRIPLLWSASSSCFLEEPHLKARLSYIILRHLPLFLCMCLLPSPHFTDIQPRSRATE